MVARALLLIGELGFRGEFIGKSNWEGETSACWSTLKWSTTIAQKKGNTFISKPPSPPLPSSSVAAVVSTPLLKSGWMTLEV